MLQFPLIQDKVFQIGTKIQDTDHRCVIYAQSLRITY